MSAKEKKSDVFSYF